MQEELKENCFLSGGTIRKTIFILTAVFLPLLFCIAGMALLPFPELEQFLEEKQSTVIRDRKGELLWIVPVDDQGLRREFVPLEKIPDHVVEIMLISEDKRFFFHPGVDLYAVIRSLYQNIRHGEIVSGASTVTMQLAGIMLGTERTLRAKMREMFTAVRIELRLSKRKILEEWLNALPFGFQAEGVGTASRIFFGKPVWKLTPAETVILAVVPRSPAAYNPFFNKEACAAAAFVLAKEKGMSIRKETIEKTVADISYEPIVKKAPHFIDYLLDHSDQTVNRERKEDIFSSLDLELTDWLRERLAYYVGREERNRIHNGAGLLLDNRTGEILAYVGAYDVRDTEQGSMIDAVHIKNQPGSAIKPFLYALAIEEGFRPNTVLPDIPLTFGAEHMYEPLNFNNAFHGPVRLRVALASSLNIPAVYTLNTVGVPRFEEFLIGIGFDSIREQRAAAGLGLALGNGEVTLFELTRAFSLFPRRGVPLTVTPVKREAAAGSGRREENGRFVSRYTADIICDILQDDASRFLGFRDNPVFDLGFPVMFKTGTADQFQNIWAVAATPDYTVGIWMGNVSGETVKGRTGSSLPARVAGELLKKVQTKNSEFPVPYNAEEVTICTLSGMAPGPVCPGVRREYLPRGEHLQQCSFHCLRDGKMEIALPPLYDQWKHRYVESAESAVFRNGRPFDMEKDFRIVYPRDGSVFYIDPAVPKDVQAVAVRAVGGDGGPVTVFVNGEMVDTVSPPYRWLFTLERGGWTVVMKTDGEEARVHFTVKGTRNDDE